MRCKTLPKLYLNKKFIIFHHMCTLHLVNASLEVNYTSYVMVSGWSWVQSWSRCEALLNCDERDKWHHVWLNQRCMTDGWHHCHPTGTHRGGGGGWWCQPCQSPHHISPTHPSSHHLPPPPPPILLIIEPVLHNIQIIHRCQLLRFGRSSYNFRPYATR